MTTKPKAPRYRIRRSQARPQSAAASPAATVAATGSDGFGSQPFPGAAANTGQRTVSRDIAEIRQEGLTGRQLRMARRLAQKHGLTPASDFDAVRLLRARGIDPFDRSHMLELVVPDAEKTEREAARRSGTQLPQPAPQPAAVPSLPPEPAQTAQSDIERIHRDIVARRRRKLAALVGRLSLFILLPTLLAFLYYAFVATPSYTTTSAFVIEAADAQAASPGLMSGGALGSGQDSIVVQEFLQSREALQQLDADLGVRAHFSDPSIDRWQRLPADATGEDVYGYFKDMMRIGYDPTEGVIRMSVTAMSPEMSRDFSEALLGYAEARIDALSERKRTDQMRGARESFSNAEAKMQAAQARVLELQQQLGVIDPGSEAASLMGQINTFETQLAEKRLQLQQLLDNARPNQARLSGVEGDISRLESLVADLRSDLTQATAGQGSLAEKTAELRMAEVDLETRTAMLQEALAQMETARVEAERQVRYLSIGVSPVPPDVPTAPIVWKNTLIVFGIFAGLYLLISMTVAILREQVSS